jgi:PmbA protein
VNIAAIAEEAARKTLSRLGAVPPATGRYPIVIDSKVAGELFGLLANSFSAKAVFEKNSLLSGRLGQEIASSCVELTDDPTLPGGAGSRSYDSEGAASRKTSLIRGGVLTRYLTDSVHARKMNLPATASASRGPRSELGISYSNLVVTPGVDSLEVLLSRYPRMIYITEFKGYHAGYQGGSGDFSFQSEGELWENGRRVGPIADFVTSGNVLELLRSIEKVGARVRRPDGSIRVPDLLVCGPSGGLMVAGR